MTFSGRTDDRLAIRELLERYADAVFRHDAEAWADCWTEGAEWDFAGTLYTGRDAIVATWRSAMAEFTLADFHIQPGAIEVEGDTARVRSYTREFLVRTDGGVREISGRYDDELVRTPPGWCFAVRRYRLVYERTTQAV